MSSAITDWLRRPRNFIWRTPQDGRAWHASATHAPGFAWDQLLGPVAEIVDAMLLEDAVLASRCNRPELLQALWRAGASDERALRELVQHCQDGLTNYVDGPAPLSFVARLAERFNGVQAAQVSFLQTVCACLLERPAGGALVERLAHGLLTHTHSLTAPLDIGSQGISKLRGAAALKCKGLKRLRRTQPWLGTYSGHAVEAADSEGEEPPLHDAARTMRGCPERLWVVANASPSPSPLPSPPPSPPESGAGGGIATASSAAGNVAGGAENAEAMGTAADAYTVRFTSYE